MTFLIKIIVVIALFAIVGSLIYSAVFLIRDKSDSKRVVRALTVRITLSVALFLMVVTLMMTGTLEPNTPFQSR